MDATHQEAEIPTVDTVLEWLASEQFEELRRSLESWPAAEVARILEAMPPAHRSKLWELVLTEQEGPVLSNLHEEARGAIMESMGDAALVAASESMDVTDLAEVLDELPGDRSALVLERLEQDHLDRLQAILAFDEETAGRLMNPDVLSVRADVTLEVVLRWLRRLPDLPPHTEALLVTDDEGHFLGVLPLFALITKDRKSLVQDHLVRETATLPASASDREVAALFERRQLISVPVLDEKNRLLGRISLEEAVILIREHADQTLLKSAGLNEDADLFAPVLPSAKRRGFWLGLNLLTVLLAAGVIGIFQEALDEIVALAVLMPIVASMGGIAGSQTLTLTIRGLALDQVASGNFVWLTIKEFWVGVINGSVWAVVIGFVTYFWFRDAGLAAVIAAAMVINLMVAALAGVIVPFALKRVGIDPALSGAVILTTVTDVVGFLTFLGFATWVLL